jgi:hypothetical protein
LLVVLEEFVRENVSRDGYVPEAACGGVTSRCKGCQSATFLQHLHVLGVDDVRIEPWSPGVNEALLLGICLLCFFHHRLLILQLSYILQQCQFLALSLIIRIDPFGLLEYGVYQEGRVLAVVEDASILDAYLFKQLVEVETKLGGGLLGLMQIWRCLDLLLLLQELEYLEELLVGSLLLGKCPRVFLARVHHVVLRRLLEEVLQGIDDVLLLQFLVTLTEGLSFSLLLGLTLISCG